VDFVANESATKTYSLEQTVIKKYVTTVLGESCEMKEIT
jgi:hypothetical protein